jgi:hypothetical protein
LRRHWSSAPALLNAQRITVDGTDLQRARVGQRRGNLQIACVPPLIKVAVSAPPLWLSLRDWRLAVGSGLVSSIPVFRSVRDYTEHE